MKLRILTYNIFFEPVAMELRMQAIGRIVERVRPAIIGFQEVTRGSLALLKKQRWTRYYDCSVDIAPPLSEAYFVVLFSALPVLALETLPFHNSGMGRELVTMRVEVAPGQSLLVGTSHLESMPECARARVAQLKDSLRFLDARVADNGDGSALAPSWASPPPARRRTTCLGAVFMGDTNLLHADMKLMDASLGRVVADLEVEHAKSGRSKCRICDETIAKDAVRVGQRSPDQLPNGQHLMLTMWYHAPCFLSRASPAETQVVQSYMRQCAVAERTVEGDTKARDTLDLASLGLPSGWKDLWLTIDGNTDENGVTFDGRVNALVRSKAFRSRLDRMYFFPGDAVRDAFTASSAAVLEAIHIVGREPIDDKLWPSDHFGLLASFDFDVATAATTTTTTTTMTTPVAAARTVQTSPPKKKVKAEPAVVKSERAGSSAAAAVEID